MRGGRVPDFRAASATTNTCGSHGCCIVANEHDLDRDNDGIACEKL
jgi:hypothetical protein